MELLTQLQNLQKEISSLSSTTLAKERETLRKDLEKTKQKLKETEFKFRNVVQEKTKLEVCKNFSVKVALFNLLFGLYGGSHQFCQC